ncbi:MULTISPECIES: hypothetical protein [unclassified Streptomyces]|uniref:hypothetical protein n=1 Tax=unclassified Streptomyces TaxID=2593676 RepID=UPI002E185358|nr:MULTISPECIES: hypothetical protein [unclassified Streptomyces]
MTGPEHYTEAEKLLGYAEARDTELRGDAEDMSFLAEAQVHATLALAAASLEQAAITAVANDAYSVHIDEWSVALSKKDGTTT